VYKSLTYVNLPGAGEDGDDLRKSPGERITKAEMSAANQTDEDIAALVESGAISEDMSEPIHWDHWETMPTGERIHPDTGDVYDPSGVLIGDLPPRPELVWDPQKEAWYILEPAETEETTDASD
jgi:hypothetical protein